MARHAPPEKLTVMISSTVRDLPEHREQVMHACLRTSMFPRMMEDLPASDEDAIAASLAMVDEADLYLGVFAYRYGHVPAGHEKSITEMEYDRAVERGIPRLIFLMGDKHPITREDVDTGDGAAKVEALRARLMKDQVVAFFNSPEELRAEAIQALVEAERRRAAAAGEDERPAPSLHYVSEIPAPPEPYVAHPYTLLRTRGLVGRQRELSLLTDWITRPGKLGDARLLCVVAIGGMGKSALTWHWWREILPQEMKPLRGAIWWSFYESDASLENFITRALTYVTGLSPKEVAREPLPERERKLLAVLDREPFAVTLDGLERILIAYAGMEAAYLRDDDLDDRTANVVAGALGLPASAAETFVGRHQLRKTADVRAGHFLRRLAQVRASRILVSSRLYPADLQTPTGGPMPGCFAVFLDGLSDEDALDLWRAYGARGSREVMLPVFHRFEAHPLLVQLLASEVASFRDAPGDFDAWRRACPDFDPFALPLVNVESHVLAVALRGLDPAARRTLHVLAGFRMPAGIETLKALLIRTPEEAADPAKKPFADLRELDATLTALEDRGLLGWDRRANRYDLHPIVRGVVWSGLDEDARTDVYGTLQTHFEAMPKIEDWHDVESLDDLTSAIELYHTLIGLGRFDDAFAVYRDRLGDATLYRLSAGRQQVEMLEWLFPDGVDALPRLSRTSDQAWALNALAQGYQLSGQPGSAVPLFRQYNEKSDDDQEKLSRGLGNLSYVLRLSGALRASESSARAALIMARAVDHHFPEGVSLYLLGLALAIRGATADAGAALQRSLGIWVFWAKRQAEGYISGQLAELALWMDDPAAARPLADRAWELAAVQHLERDFIRAARLQGTAALRLGGPGDLATADERLHHALTRARACHLVQEELPTLIALAELHRRRGEPGAARELLEEVWESAERGPYPLFHADALNLLAQLERDAGQRDAAAEAARRAYELAWCDGPPWAYHRGLEQARAHLVALGTPEPELAPFDESKYEPMPEVEINPPDEFGSEVATGDGRG